jgi:hypothetical protein
MHCSKCGAKSSGAAIRCPVCTGFTPAFWMNLYSLSLLAFLSVTNLIYVWKMVPIVATMARLLGFELPLAMRIYLHWINISAYFGLPAVALTVGALFALRRRKIPIPRFITSGALLAAAAFMALVFSVGGIMIGYVEVLVLFPRFIE